MRKYIIKIYYYIFIKFLYFFFIVIYYIDERNRIKKNEKI